MSFPSVLPLRLSDFFDEGGIGTAAVLSLVFAGLFVIGTAALLLFILKADENFFVRLREREEMPIRVGALFVLRNLVGGVLLVSGILMLFLPGQGVLTILNSLLFLEFPGKRKLIARILDNPRTQEGLNRFRRRFGKKQFNFRKSL